MIGIAASHSPFDRYVDLHKMIGMDWKHCHYRLIDGQNVNDK